MLLLMEKVAGTQKQTLASEYEAFGTQNKLK